MCMHKDLYRNVYNSFICNILDSNIHQQVNGYTDCVISMEYNRILLSNKNEQTTDTNNNMDESTKYHIPFPVYLNHIISQVYKQIATNNSQPNPTILLIPRCSVYTYGSCITMQISNFPVVKGRNSVPQYVLSLMISFLPGIRHFYLSYPFPFFFITFYVLPLSSRVKHAYVFPAINKYFTNSICLLNLIFPSFGNFWNKIPFTEHTSYTGIPLCVPLLSKSQVSSMWLSPMDIFQTLSSFMTAFKTLEGIIFEGKIPLVTWLPWQHTPLAFISLDLLCLLLVSTLLAPFKYWFSLRIWPKSSNHYTKPV